MTEPVRDPRIEALFAPHSVVAYTCAVTPTLIERLHPAEAEAAVPMADGRTAEFATARACAHAALRELALDGPVPRSSSGAPQWPDGVVGSITHTRGFCAAVVSHMAISIGLDAEQQSRIRPAIERRILVDAERHELGDSDGRDRRNRVAAIFAAKESFYKAHYEIEPRYLGFDAVQVHISDEHVDFLPSSGAVAPELLAQTSGRKLVDQGRVLVGTVIENGALKPGFEQR